MPASANSADIIPCGAAELARRIHAREVSSHEVVTAFIRQIEAVDGELNAVVVRFFDQALDAARQADAQLARGEPCGPLHGVPLTVKECFEVAGAAATIGLPSRKSLVSTSDGILVQRLRRAGGILLGKTNVPQMMLWHECDNPVYGRTNNPWDLGRTPGGSTGGEAAIIAACGSPLGLANDLGGSIRVPAHFCGIHGIKPTSHRLPRSGAIGTLNGMEAILTQPGPLARWVDDLTLGMKALADDSAGCRSDDVSTAPFPDPRGVNLRGLKIALWTDDGFFTASPAIRRAVVEAGQALVEQGAIVEEFSPPQAAECFDTYVSLIGADGAADARRLTRGNPLDWRVARLMWIGSLPALLRLPLAAALRMLGQGWLARLISATGARSTDGYWQLVVHMRELTQQFLEKFHGGGFSACLCPPHALPAMQHGKAIDLVAAASYTFLPNLLGLPAGTFSLTRVRAGEDQSRPLARDQVLRQARAVDLGSVGLPVGVQIVADYWREDVVLAIMAALERQFGSRADFPLSARLPVGSIAKTFHE